MGEETAEADIRMWCKQRSVELETRVSSRNKSFFPFVPMEILFGKWLGKHPELFLVDSVSRFNWKLSTGRIQI